MKYWIQAFRLRTLPLALSSIWMGSFIAWYHEMFNWQVCLLACVTTLFLQILSNLANDYGDSIHGADSTNRIGPTRAVQSGMISSKSMKVAIIIFAFLSFISGISLLLISFQPGWLLLGFIILGICCIVAAIKYTAGANPYGYAGLGDLSVFIFFGLTGVAGTFFLQAGFMEYTIFFPAISCGLFSVAVLNLNNMRDINSDALAGKKSIPVRLGLRYAKIYHYIIVLSGLFFAVLYVFIQHGSRYEWLFLLSAPLLFKNLFEVSKRSGRDLDPLLKQMALSTLVFVLFFGLGLNFEKFRFLLWINKN